jgi:hypothetical protein
MNNQWRFKPEKLSQLKFKSENNRILSATEFLQKMSLLLEEKSYKNEDILSNLDKNHFVVSSKRINIENSKYYPNVQIKDKMDITFLDYKKYDDKKLFFDGITIEHLNGLPNPNLISDFTAARTFTKSLLEKRTNYTNQQITIAKFNQGEVLGKGYKLRFDCCRLDGRNYFNSSKIKSGVLINSTFFDFKNTFKPIGYTKIGDLVFKDFVIPNPFRKYYGFVGINKYGKLIINNDVEASVKYQHDVISIGPVLVYDGKIQFTSETLKITNNGEYLFQSDNMLKNVNKYENDDIIPHHVDDIKPGELYHAGNPNPRSALVIDNNDNLIFVKVEGRDIRDEEGKPGVGMDLSQLAQFCKNYLNAKHAINLDGGRSSQITWKEPNKNFVNIEGGVDNGYVIGSVIALTKEN